MTAPHPVLQPYDVLIIGSGMSGMVCAATLSREGMNVCLIEKNPIFGGCLQSFRRHGVQIDTGVHYVGALGEGQIMRQILHYNKVLPNLHLRQMDQNGFETLHMEGKTYLHPMGYERQQETFSQYFPQHKDEIRRLLDTLHTIGNKLSLENFRQGIIDDNDRTYMQLSAAGFLEQTISDPLLRDIYSSSATIIAGEHDSTPLYHYAMVRHSNIIGAYRFEDGSQHIANAYLQTIQSQGGTTLSNTPVTSICVSNGLVTGVETSSGEFLPARNIISTLHPVETFRLLEQTPLVRKAYLTRLKSLQNSSGLFSLYLLMKPNSFPYLNTVHFLFEDRKTWIRRPTGKTPELPTSLMLSTQAHHGSPYTRLVCLMKLMDYSELLPWEQTIVEHRGESYLEFKHLHQEQMINQAEHYFPGLKKSIQAVYTSTPLTYRDYIASPQGGAFGINTDSRFLLGTLISPRTRIPNLFLSGQSLSLSGILGTSVTALLTCSNLIGEKYLAQKIANE